MSERYLGGWQGQALGYKARAEKAEAEVQRLQKISEGRAMTSLTRIDQIALAVTKILRLGAVEKEFCPHGLPFYVGISEPPPWSGRYCVPLCDACVMAAVRQALREAEQRGEVL